MQGRFSQANRAVVQAAVWNECGYFCAVVVIGTFTVCGSIIETYFSVSKEEIEHLRYIYKRSHPERRLQTNFWVPFVDDSESYYYEVIFHVEFYLIFLFDQLCSLNIFMKIFFNNLIFALFLFQLTLSSISMSKARLCKLVAEFVAFGIQYFYLCNKSDLLDDCNGNILRAIGNSGCWMRCSSQTRRDLCMLIRRVQKPNHLRFFQGAIIISRDYFMRVVKLSYSLVNFMRIKSAAV
ncbi:hypothetical protein WDU94_001736 [Cyamophila willieti]